MLDAYSQGKLVASFGGYDEQNECTSFYGSPNKYGYDET